MICQDLILSWSSLNGDRHNLHFMENCCYQRISDTSDYSSRAAQIAQGTLQVSGWFSQYLWKWRPSMCHQRPSAARLAETLRRMQCQMVSVAFLSFLFNLP